MTDRQEQNNNASPLDEARVGALHKKAQAGCTRSRQTLLVLLYDRAVHYFTGRLRGIEGLTQYDAQELASQFILELVQRWAGIRQLKRYAYSVMRKKLYGYVAQKRRVGRIEFIADIDLLLPAGTAAPGIQEPGGDLDDETLRAYDIYLEELRKSDAKTRAIVLLRDYDPPSPYSVIAAHLEMGESTARMRHKRFRERVGKRLGIDKSRED